MDTQGYIVDTQGNKWIHRVTSGYTGLHMDTQGNKWIHIHRVTYGYTG